MSEGRAPEPVERYGSTHAVHFVPRDPEWYRGRSRFFHHRTHAFLPRDPGAAILDLACGAGEFLYYLRSRGFTAARGIDLSEEQLTLARAMGLQNVARGDAFDHLRAHPAAYDFILASHIVEHLPKDRVVECLGLMGKALRAGGQLVVLLPNAGSPLGLPYAFGDFTHEVYFTAMSLAQAAALAGLPIVRIAGITPDAGSASGALKAALWAAVLRPLLVSFLGDRRMRFGHVLEPEIVGVFARPGDDRAALPADPS
jgi:SAM-dependent methyltransferase